MIVKPMVFRVLRSVPKSLGKMPEGIGNEGINEFLRPKHCEYWLNYSKDFCKHDEICSNLDSSESPIANAGVSDKIASVGYDDKRRNNQLHKKRFPFFRNVQVFLQAISPVYRLKYPYSTFSPHFWGFFYCLFLFLMFFCLNLYYYCFDWLL